MKNETETTCPHCGAKTVTYRHVLNQGLITSLIKLASAGGEAKTSDLDLTYTQRNNFQKLQYFSLTMKEKGKRHVWIMTPLARDFLHHDKAIHSVVWTYRGGLVKAPTDEKPVRITINSVDGLPKDWRESIDYSNDAEPAQTSLNFGGI